MKIVTFTYSRDVHCADYKCSKPDDQSGNYVPVTQAQDLLRAAQMYQKALEALMGEMEPDAKYSFATAIAVVTARDHGAKIIAGLEKNE